MFQDSIPKKEVSDNPSYHRENEIHQYDSTFHFYFGSEVIESAYSMIRFSSLFLYLLSLKTSSFKSWDEDAKFFELWKIVKGSPSWTSGRSKTFHSLPVQFCVFRGNPESQRGKVLEFRIVEVWSGTWVAPELLPVSRS